MFYCIDRILGRSAILIGDDGSQVDVSLSELPVGSKEGTTLFYENGRFEIDEVEQSRRKSATQEVLDNIARRSKLLRGR